MSNYLNVLVYEPNKRPVLDSIPNTLNAMQRFVGGSLEPLCLWDQNLIVVYNKEGKENGLTFNRAIKNEDGDSIQDIYGRFFICGDTEDGDFASIPNPKLAEMLWKDFQKEPLNNKGLLLNDWNGIAAGSSTQDVMAWFVDKFGKKLTKRVCKES